MRKQDIELFLAEKSIGFVGVSRDAKKFSNTVYEKLKESGHELHPVHPNADSVGGDVCVPTIQELPIDVHTLMLIARPDVCAAVLKDIPESISRIWVFSGPGRHGNVDAQVERLRSAGVNVISGLCPCMFIEPVGSFHAFHRFLARLFGTYPK